MEEMKFTFLFFFFWFLLYIVICWAFPAKAQHNPEDMDLHTNFYASWNRPDPRYNGHGEEEEGSAYKKGDRYLACCNNRDCEPMKTKFVGDHWEAYWKLKEKWVVIPDILIESNQPDPRESPDGQSHVCINQNSEHVLCVVLGSGQ